MTPDANQIKQLKHRRQFFITPRSQPDFEHWRRINIESLGWLHLHPELGFCRADHGESSLLLIGYILDPTNPDADDVSILRRILAVSKTAEQAAIACEHFVGRWLMIYISPSEQAIFGDACCLRQAHYLADGKAVDRLASDPALLANLSDINPDEEIERRFIKSGYFEKSAQYWWPDGLTPYRNIKRLPPNHLLDLQSGELKRFWPRRPLTAGDHHRVIEQARDRLINSIASAAARFPLALPLTAGLDSRILLGACRTLEPAPLIYTLMLEGMGDEHEDAVIARRICSASGREHLMIDCREPAPEWFGEIYRESNFESHRCWETMVWGQHKVYPPDHFSLRGNCSEIARCAFYPRGRPPRPTVELMAALTNMHHSSLAKERLSEGLARWTKVEENFGYYPLDLFYWEDKMASWQALLQTEWDLAMECFTPFNDRLLIELLLSAPEIYRTPPTAPLFFDLLKSMGGDLASYPINPGMKDRIKKDIKGTLIRLGLWSGVKRFVS